MRLSVWQAVYCKHIVLRLAADGQPHECPYDHSSLQLPGSPAGQWAFDYLGSIDVKEPWS